VDITAETARFLGKKVHRFKVISENHAISYCGLSERAEIWREQGGDVTCAVCIQIGSDPETTFELREEF
jgi:hypothetical protein